MFDNRPVTRDGLLPKRIFKDLAFPAPGLLSRFFSLQKHSSSSFSHSQFSTASKQTIHTQDALDTSCTPQRLAHIDTIAPTPLQPRHRSPYRRRNTYIEPNPSYTYPATLITTHTMASEQPKPSTAVESKPTNKHDNFSDISSMMAKLPGEIRNLIYANYFPAVPPTKTPLITAHEYRLSNDLCFASKGLASETLAYLQPVRNGWNNATWQVSLDDQASPMIDPVDGIERNIHPSDITANLTDADAARIHTLEFSTCVFVLPPTAPEDKIPTLSTPFTFTITRSSTHRLSISTPLLEDYWKKTPDLLVDNRVCRLLRAAHLAVCAKLVWDKKSGLGRHVWTVREITILIAMLNSAVMGLLLEGEEGTMGWNEVYHEAEDMGVWEGRMRGKESMVEGMEAWCADENGEGLEGTIWACMW